MGTIDCAMKGAKIAPLAVLCVALSGCPVSTLNRGVARSADLGAMPSIECVREVIVSTPGVVDAQYQQTKLAGEWNSAGQPIATIQHVFRYRGGEGSHIAAALRFLDKADGTVSLYHSLMGVSAPPQTDVDATRPVMAQVEHELASQCGMTSLPAQIEEICLGVECTPLPEPSALP